MGKIIPSTMGIQWRWMIFFGALAQCSSAASSSKRAENIKTLLTKQEVIRADKYIANAQHHFGQYLKVLREEMEGDLFLHCWATTQAELEPLAPFHQRVHFAPRSGDMVLFPSYLPHRISKHESPPKGERVAWAFNLEGGVDTW